MRGAALVSVTVCLSLIAGGCERAPTAATRVDFDWLSDAAGAGVDKRGLFKLAQAPVGELAERQAVSLAEGYVRRFGRWLAPSWAEDRGSDVAYEALRMCGRAYYASSTYVDLPPTVNAQVRARFGPRWFVTMCTGSVPQVNVAVSALATHQVWEGALGGFFVSRGIPESLSDLIMAPEEAARLVHEATGLKISGVPELVVPPLPSVPQLAKWRVSVGESIASRGEQSRTKRSTRIFYVGAGRSWHWTGLQAAHPDSSEPPVLALHSTSGQQSIQLQVHPDRAAFLEPITVERR